MPAVPLVDLSTIDLESVLVDRDTIGEYNPHRFEFRLLDGIVHYDHENSVAVGYHDTDPEGFWVRGHIPGSPIFPGALMIEAGAQLASYVYQQTFPTPEGKFFGFGGLEKVRFRGGVGPGQRLWLACKKVILNRRYGRYAVQGTVDGEIIFDGEIIGIQITRPAAE